MRTRSAVTLATLLVGSLLTRPAAASDGLLFMFGVVVLALPAHVGADVRPDGDSPARVVVGWSYQIPLGHARLIDQLTDPSPHRFVFGGDLLLGGGTGGRARLGYRFSTDRLFAGAGVAGTTAGLTLSPEVGVKFAHFGYNEQSSLHLLARAEIEPDLRRVRATTIVLGWNFH